MRKIYFIFFILLYFSSFCFSQWREANKGLEELKPWYDDIYNIMSLNGNLFAINGSSGKLLLSENYGSSWSVIDIHKSNSYPYWCKNCLASSGDTAFFGNQYPTNYDTIIGRCWDIIYRSNDNFKTWEVVCFNVTIPLSAMAVKNNYIYIGWGDGYGTVSVSSDFGQTWESKYSKLNPYNYDAVIVDIHIFNSRIFVSLDNPNNPEYNGIYYTDDEMESFSRCELKGNIKSKIKMFENNGILYAGAFSSSNSTGETYISIDSGLTWNSMDTYFGDFTPVILNFAFKDSIHIVSGFKEAQVIISTDNGMTWKKKDGGLDIGPNCLTILGDYVFAGTGNGIYRARLDELTAVEDSEPVTNTVSIIPNPFFEKTNIKYSVNNPGNVRLAIYNSLGNEVAVLVDDLKPAGSYEAKFDGAGLAQGVYFYILRTADYTLRGKLLFIKN